MKAAARQEVPSCPSASPFCSSSLSYTSGECLLTAYCRWILSVVSLQNPLRCSSFLLFPFCSRQDVMQSDKVNDVFFFFIDSNNSPKREGEGRWLLNAHLVTHFRFQRQSCTCRRRFCWILLLACCLLELSTRDFYVQSFGCREEQKDLCLFDLTLPAREYSIRIFFARFFAFCCRPSFQAGDPFSAAFHFGPPLSLMHL